MPRLPRDALIDQAEQFVRDGADVIDLGCDPGTPWNGIGDAVKSLRDRGLRVSIDSFDPAEVSLAVAAGAELVLSVNATNRDRAVDWGVEVVAIPDQPGSLGRWRNFPDVAADPGIGLHGFLHGGLIVDGGRRDEVHPPPLVVQMPFPEEWSILIVQPPGPRGRHGPDDSPPPLTISPPARSRH